METFYTGVLLVDRNFHAFTCRYTLETANIRILAWKQKAHHSWSDKLSPYMPRTLSLWKLKGDMIITKLTPQKELSEVLGKIDVNDMNTIEELADHEKVANIGLSEDETLLLQVPAVVTDNSPAPVIPGTVAPEYGHCFLKANSSSGFTKEDIKLNDIHDSVNTPVFVVGHERFLNQKRKLPPEMRVFAGIIDEGLVAEYFCLAEEPSESNPIVNPPEVNQCEMQHLINLSFVNPGPWRTLDSRKTRFKKSDAYWLFFSAVTFYYESHYNSLVVRSTIEINQSFESWPFSLLIKVDNDLRTYKPKNDFLILKHGLPRLAVEVNSTKNGTLVDRIRLMLQGASIVRFANTNLDAYNEKRDFVFVAIYIDGKGKAERCLLYQEETGNSIYRTQRNFDLTKSVGRMAFALELYNLSSTWRDSERTAAQVDKLRRAVDEELPEYTGARFTHLADTHGDDSDAGGNDSDTGGDDSDTDGDDSDTSDTSEDQRQPKKPRTDAFGSPAGVGAGRGAAGRFEDSGYEVVRDAWRPINKPPHVRIVYRRGDPNKTQYIAKHLREGSNELDIYEYLRSRPSQSPYIISFIEAVPSTTREWLILPKMYPISHQWSLDENGAAGRVRLGWGLIEGLAHLHEHNISHRDIKPDNLVRDRDFNLKIIDFDIFIKVEDENTEIKGYWGTEGWTAPEIGKQDDRPKPVYSPIRADRWSCGRVILRHIMVGDMVMNADPRLLNFANQLMAKDPQHRPSLLGWHKFRAAPPISVARYRYWEESVKQPDRKKHRLEPEFIHREESVKHPDRKKRRLEPEPCPHLFV